MRGNGWHALIGFIDEIVIWNTAISDIEDLETLDDNLIAHYKFNQGPEGEHLQTLIDHSGNQNHGEIYGADWILEGCTDNSACNYDSNATLDDNSCISSIECNLCNPCDLSSGTVSILNESELWYNIDEDIAGFQLTVYGEEVVISDITSDYPEFDAYYNKNSPRVLVFSSTSFGASIPSGCGILLNIIYTGEITDVDVIFVNWDEEEMGITYQNCFQD